jgi:hypothetical protein
MHALPVNGGAFCLIHYKKGLCKESADNKENRCVALKEIWYIFTKLKKL